eukprot:2788394-Rhodomonas_salina.2
MARCHDTCTHARNSATRPAGDCRRVGASGAARSAKDSSRAPRLRLLRCRSPAPAHRCVRSGTRCHMACREPRKRFSRMTLAELDPFDWRADARGMRGKRGVSRGWFRVWQTQTLASTCSALADHTL